MITQNYQTLTPAYSRDYKSAKDAIADFKDGKDFNLNSPTLGFTLCSIRDFQIGVTVNIRYSNLRKIATYRVGS